MGRHEEHAPTPDEVVALGDEIVEEAKEIERAQKRLDVLVERYRECLDARDGRGTGVPRER